MEMLRQGDEMSFGSLAISNETHGFASRPRGRFAIVVRTSFGGVP